METNTNLTKKERRALRKQEKMATQEQLKQRQGYMKLLWWGLGVLVVVIAVVAVIRNSSPDASAHEWIRGDANASVTLIEYADFQCPACAAYSPLVTQLHETFPEDLRIIFRHYPLTTIHANALPAARAAEAAGAQGKFWEMHDRLYETQLDWSGGDTDKLFSQYAGELGLDVARFAADMNDGGIGDKIRADQREGNRNDVSGTPTFFLNGRKIANPAGFEQFRALVQQEIDQMPADERVSGETESAAVHEHADIKVILRGQSLDLSQDKYQSHGHDADGNEVNEDKHPYLHLHDGNGAIVHKHSLGYTLADFFASLGITLTDECLTLDTGEAFCENEAESLRFVVNGEARDDIAGYEFTDLDRMLISFGNEDEAALQAQIASVSDEACIYSETCPERGTPPTENCIGGLGTNCE